MCDFCPAACSSSSCYYYHNLLLTPTIDPLPPSLCLSCRSSHLQACMRRRSMAILSVVGSVKHARIRLASATADDTNKAINTIHAQTLVPVPSKIGRVDARQHAPMHWPCVQTHSHTQFESGALGFWRSHGKYTRRATCCISQCGCAADCGIRREI
jgi:hypothetical protein